MADKQLPQYYVEFESQALWELLAIQAKAKGTYSVEHSDWFQPYEIIERVDARDLETARKEANRLLREGAALYGNAEIYQRVPDEEYGGFDSVLVEHVEAER